MFHLYTLEYPFIHLKNKVMLQFAFKTIESRQKNNTTTTIFIIHLYIQIPIKLTMYLGMYLIGCVCVFGFQIVQFGCGVFFLHFLLIQMLLLLWLQCLGFSDFYLLSPLSFRFPCSAVLQTQKNNLFIGISFERTKRKSKLIKRGELN